MRSAYEILGVSPEASTEIIRAAYRKLAKTHHPDRTEGATHEQFLEIRAAYEILIDPQRRAAYDLAPDETFEDYVLIMRRIRTRRRRYRLMRLY